MWIGPGPAILGALVACNDRLFIESTLFIFAKRVGLLIVG